MRNDCEMHTESPPKPRPHRERLPEAARSLMPGQYLDTHGANTARCIRSFGRLRGWKMVQQTVDGITRIWRLE